METIKDLFFVSYIKHKGIRRICFIAGLVSSLPFALIFLLEPMSVINGDYELGIRLASLALIAFYLPFLIACAGKWIYLGFKENK